MRIIVAGGGLVGLTTAAVLGHAGHDVTVLEKDPEIRSAGAGISLWSNAMRELDKIGIGPDVRNSGQEIVGQLFDMNGRAAEVEGFAEADARTLLVPRPALMSLLAAAVGPEHILHRARVTGFADSRDGVVVGVADRTSLRADLLIGADGINSRVRAQLIPGSVALPHANHYAWRAIVPTGAERPGGTAMTIGHDGTRGGHRRVAPGRTMWIVAQFQAGSLTCSTRDRALRRAHHLRSPGWNDDLLEMIARTPEESILESRIMQVPRLPRWTGARVALVGDAAHAISPHIAAGGTLGMEDAGVLCAALAETPDPAEALARYEQNRMARFDRVRALSADVERAENAEEYAQRWTAFSHWMQTTAPAT